MSALDLALSFALGIALAAATGFRVFLPLLIASLAAHTGHLRLGESFGWLASEPALVMLGVAAAAEALAYYVPFVDNLLDLVATPAALIAGAIVSAAVMADVPPLVRWPAAIIAGGGAAGVTQSVTALLRAKSSALTGGLGNPLIATAELAGAVLLSVLAIAAPFIALAAALVIAGRLLHAARRRAARRG